MQLLLFGNADDDDDGAYPFDTSRVYQELTRGQINISVAYYDVDYNLLFTDTLVGTHILLMIKK